MNSKQFMVNSLYRNFYFVSYDTRAEAATPLRERRAAPRAECHYPARLISSDRSISVDGGIVNISVAGAKIEAAYPLNGPSVIILHELENNELYECEIRWNSGKHVGLQFLDLFGPERRRRFFAGRKVPVRAPRLVVVR